ncbi:MAG: response regulator [Acidobacteriia bacterium]|nr:response regulator [Terriglobia bacterium]
MAILAVDDEPFVVEMIQDVLEKEGHTCLTAASVEEAEWIAGQAPIEGLILDIGMPGKAPLDWLEELALARPELARRTLVVTGYTLEEGLVLRIHGCGARILSKPFNIRELVEEVRRLAPPPAASSSEAHPFPRRPKGTDPPAR